MPTLKPDLVPLTIGHTHSLAFMSCWLWEGGNKVWTKLGEDVLLFTIYRKSRGSFQYCSEGDFSNALVGRH